MAITSFRRQYRRYYLFDDVLLSLLLAVSLLSHVDILVLLLNLFLPLVPEGVQRLLKQDHLV
jgi:hypothetical protein